MLEGTVADSHMIEIDGLRPAEEVTQKRLWAHCVSRMVSMIPIQVLESLEANGRVQGRLGMAKVPVEQFEREGSWVIL